MIISPSDPSALIVAANHVFVSHDRGDSWTMISPDLTSNANRDTIVPMGLKGSEIRVSRDDGVSPWPAIVTLAESPKQPGGDYTGSDDGLLYVSRDAGKSWQNITKNLPGAPAGGWVSKVAPSAYDAGTVYVTIDNHRLNDFKPYVWVSTDFGTTFRSLSDGLQSDVVKTFTEDQRNRDVLYIGTETGIMVSLDRGKSWARLQANLPTVRVDEITLHPRDNAMLVATRGPSAVGAGPPRADYRRTRPRRARTRSSSPCRRRSSGRPRTTATTSSGAINTSSAKSAERGDRSVFPSSHR
jgi:hypothetical protein